LFIKALKARALRSAGRTVSGMANEKWGSALLESIDSSYQAIEAAGKK
jgi:hypothetical protein